MGALLVEQQDRELHVRCILALQRCTTTAFRRSFAAGKRPRLDLKKLKLCSKDSLVSCFNGGISGSLFSVWPFSVLIRPKLGGRSGCFRFPLDSIMDWFLMLESGEFWFLAQVYNCQIGHDGFVLSCYDAEIFREWPADCRGKHILE